MSVLSHTLVRRARSFFTGNYHMANESVRKWGVLRERLFGTTWCAADRLEEARRACVLRARVEALAAARAWLAR